MTDDDRISIAALIGRMADGDESALGMLYDLWADHVHTAAFWILQDRDEAEDVVEETFWQAWRNASRYDSRRASGLTWLMMIARSRALDRVRSQRRRAEWIAAPATTAALLEEGFARRPDELPAGGDRETAELACALGALPFEQRQAIELAFLGGLSHSEIAEQTSQPLGTVKTRIRLAMAKLRERLSLLREEGA